MTDVNTVNNELELQNQIKNLDQQIKNESAIARLNATKDKSAAFLALKRKKLLQNQKKQLLATITVLQMNQDSEDDDSEDDLDVDSVMELATKAMENERKKQRDIISSSKATENTPENSSLLPSLEIVCLVGIGLLIAFAYFSRRSK